MRARKLALALLTVAALAVPAAPVAAKSGGHGIGAEQQPSSVERRLLAAGFKRVTDPKVIAALNAKIAAGELRYVPGTEANPPGYHEPHACSGYTNLASFADPWDYYLTTGNVCGFYADISGGLYSGTIVRFKCYRRNSAGDLQLSQRCRWAWNMITQYQAGGFNWVTKISGDYLWPNTGGFDADSDRIWGAAQLTYAGVPCRGAIRSTSTQAYRVRFDTVASGEQLRTMFPNPHFTGNWANCPAFT
jgi:hypothetical protein